MKDKNLVFVGGGGFFAEVLDYMYDDFEKGTLRNVKLRGVLDDSDNCNTLGLEYLGCIDSYIPHSDDYFLVCIGNPLVKKKAYDKLAKKSVKFFTYTHSSCYIAKSAKIGQGVILCAGVIVNSRAIVFDNVAINVYSSIGHDSHVGSHSVISPFVALNGGASIGKGCFLSTRATVFPKVGLGDYCTVDVHSYVKNNVEDRKIISCGGIYKVFKNRLIDRGLK